VLPALAGHGCGTLDVDGYLREARSDRDSLALGKLRTSLTVSGNPMIVQTFTSVTPVEGAAESFAAGTADSQIRTVLL